MGLGILWQSGFLPFRIQDSPSESRSKPRHWMESRHSSAKFIALDGNLCTKFVAVFQVAKPGYPGFSPEREEPARFRRERGYPAGLWKSLLSQQLQRELAREQAESEEGHGVLCFANPEVGRPSHL